MNIALIGLGRAGSHIADSFTREETKRSTYVSQRTLAIDTTKRHLSRLTRITEEDQLLIGTNKFEGRGTGSRPSDAKPVLADELDRIPFYLDDLSRTDLDAFVLISALGGGTGGPGASILAQILREEYDHPIYGVGVLPAKHEGEAFTLNAARAIQSYSRDVDNLLLFDNEQFGVGKPKWMDSIDESQSKTDVFRDANRTLAGALHLLFSVDEVSVPARLEGSTPTTANIQEALEAGGLSTLAMVSEGLPLPAQNGIRGRVAELATYIADAVSAGISKTTTEMSPPEDSTDPGNEPIPSRQRPNQTGGESNSPEPRNDLELEDLELDLDGAVVGAGSAAAHQDPVVDENDGRDWPHPIKLLPDALRTDNAFVECDPADTRRNLFILAGPARHLQWDHPNEVSRWAQEHTRAEMSIAGNFPRGKKTVHALALCSNITLPERLYDLQDRAELVIEKAQEQERRTPDPEAIDPFEQINSDIDPHL